MQPILPATLPVKRSKVPPVNITVTVTESFGVNRPLDPLLPVPLELLRVV